MKFWFIRLLLLVFTLIFPFNVWAVDDFATSTQVVYSFDAVGNLLVTQNIRLTNLTSNIYASSYQLQFGQDLPKNITAYDSVGKYSVSTHPQDSSGYLADIQFPAPLVGKNQTRSFSISYSGQSAVKKGQIWEINLPFLHPADSAELYSYELVVPASWGQPAYISPSFKSTVTEKDSQIYYFSLSDAKTSGITAAFGNFQVFDFSLRYLLSNPGSEPGFTQIALPPDTAYQQVFFDSISPQPLNVSVDTDGNWIARYNLSKHQELEVSVTGQAHVLAQPRIDKNFYHPVPGPEYLSPQEFWPVTDPLIANLAKKYSTPREIFDYVSSFLKYDYTRLNDSSYSRAGALAALNHPERSLCQDFTDLFITLSRAAGIPAREIQGYAYTTDPQLKPVNTSLDVLHSWPEYFDSSQKQWLSVDPTWSATTGGTDYFSKFDFNHFAFVVHGQNSDFPYPAGTRPESVSSKSRLVNVSLGTFRNYPSRDIQVSYQHPFQIFPFRLLRGNLILSNPNGHALYNSSLLYSTRNIQIDSSFPDRLTVFPPYSSQEFPFFYTAEIIPRHFPKSLTLSLNSRSMTYNLSGRYFALWYAILTIIASFTFFVLVFVAHFAWSLYLQRRSRNNSLRR